MIYAVAKITLHRDHTASVDRKITLYKGDKNVEIQFEIVESVFKQYKQEGNNTIENLGASYGELLIIKPDYTCAISELAPTKDGRIIFVVPEEMTDEYVDLGAYTFQIRMYDETLNSRVTLPPVVGGIVVADPIVGE